MKKRKEKPECVVNWHLAAGVKYFRLLDDASDSPITDDRGSADQVFAGLGVACSW